MRINHELQRYIWLECSPHRLIAMPVFIAVVFFLLFQSPNPQESIHFGSLMIFGALLFLWGGNKAAESMADEINDNTWDFQRLSSISPWSIVLGKFAAPIYCWYGGIMALVAYIITSIGVIPFQDVIRNLVLLIGGSFLCHAVAMLVVMQHVVGRSARTKIRAIGGHVAGLLVVCMFASHIVIFDHLKGTPETFELLKWYGIECSVANFMVVHMLIALAWAVGGAYWLIRSQLRMRTGPWFWVAFVIYSIVFINGFHGWEEMAPMADVQIHYRSLVAFYMALGATGIMLVMEPWSGLRYKKWLISIGSRDRRNISHLFPCWLASLVITFIATLWLVMMNLQSPKFLIFALAMLAFFVRDIGIFHYFRLNPNSRRAFSAAVFYILVLYVLFPLVFTAVGLGDVNSLFWPTPDNVGLSLLSAAIQALVIVCLCIRQWKRYWVHNG